jgi:hypothetical protein
MAVAWTKLSPILFPRDDGASTRNDTTDVTTETAQAGVLKTPGKRPGDSGRTPGRPGKEGSTVVSQDPPREANRFPRRALVISVHNYLYANPVAFGTPVAGGRNVTHLLDAISDTGLKIPRNQIFHLSDLAEKGRAR